LRPTRIRDLRMKMFVWIVTALFCGAGAGAVVVNIAWQQRVKAENKARIEILETEREAERERIEAGIFTDEEADVFIKMLKRVHELTNLANTNGTEFERQIMAMTAAEHKALRNFVELRNTQSQHNIQQAYLQGYQQGINAQPSRSYSHQQHQPTQSYSHQPQRTQRYSRHPHHSQVYSNVQRNDGSWAIHDNNGRFVTSGRFEAVDNDYFNVLRSDGSWAVHDKNMRFATAGRATKNSAGTYNVQRHDRSFAIHDRNMRFQTSGRVN